MQARRDKGLCYNCDEKFAPRHRCKTQQVFLLETIVDDGALEHDEQDQEYLISQPEISLHALSSVANP